MRLRLLAALTLSAVSVLMAPGAVHAMTGRQHVDHAMTLKHAARGTLTFFSKRPELVWTGPLQRRRIAKAAIRYAHIRLRQARVEMSKFARPAVPQDSVTSALICIHGGEGAWSDETGNGYHGGLQMDYSFETTYGPEFYRQWGDAGHWPPWAQLVAARRAYFSGRGFGPWPNTARACGLSVN